MTTFLLTQTISPAITSFNTTWKNMLGINVNLSIFFFLYIFLAILSLWFICDYYRLDEDLQAGVTGVTCFQFILAHFLCMRHGNCLW